jgi:hydrogenase maturation protease
MRRSLVIGYGNTLRGDDGLGVVAAEKVAERLPDVTVLTSHQLVPEMAESISQAELVVFVDASAETAPGTISTHKIDPDKKAPSSVTHFLDPATLLLLTQELFGVVPIGVLVTMGSAEFDFGTQLSPTIQAAMPDLVSTIICLISPK